MIFYQSIYWQNRKLNKIKVGVVYDISPAYRLKKWIMLAQLSRSLYWHLEISLSLRFHGFKELSTSHGFEEHITFLYGSCHLVCHFSTNSRGEYSHIQSTIFPKEWTFLLINGIWWEIWILGSYFFGSVSPQLFAFFLILLKQSILHELSFNIIRHSNILIFLIDHRISLRGNMNKFWNWWQQWWSHYVNVHFLGLPSLKLTTWHLWLHFLQLRAWF